MAKKQIYSSFKPRRALLSVSDKRGIRELGQALHDQGVELIATGNTAAILREHKLPVTDVSECTGFPEIMDGRVKTLHPAIHAGLLARGEQDSPVLRQHGIKPIDLLIVNLYPFEQVINHPDCDFNKAIENIDIGGPAMVRAAAKNHAHTYVIVDPNDYSKLIHYLQDQKAPSHWNFALAKKAFAHTAAYDAAIANYLTTLDNDYVPTGFPDILTCQFNKVTDLRYGENPHQQAIFYADKNSHPGSLSTATLLQGKQLSYNNILDADAALDCVKSFSNEKSVCVIVKHTNPCGIALSDTSLDAYLKAFQSDPISAYGGIIAFNGTLDSDTAKAILEKQFVEVIIAPDANEEAKKILAAKENIRVLLTGFWQQGNNFRLSMKKVDGGLLVQEHDSLSLESCELQTVTQIKPTDKQLQNLMFAWLAAKHVKSNAIVYANDLATIGIGGGQTSRVMSARIGLWQAEQMGFDPKGAVMASDAFIPFPDTIEIAAKAGISAIIQPGGSIRDEKIISCADQHNIAMIFTGVRHFKH
ncbi:TPA: bifunctional phosphoribosylaminoimidazolecarboxamide formyltransferase/IMP cyclohydrolase [Legionella pneumophila subsp. pneumophila]|uniref:bifunctional phosphoribosylaminoimidazolecarboxamide formyltransferase/IMP cyclohydrolase n=1 Tax=Legionella pneumophila TaxID=446 RepID=UPI0001E3C9E0|nr:bifunctional phosphoribosylaminoimidazolecarboxamide formyltransferase/IMP cyclohydrolase [Legionella pneumophila]MDC8030400.1 bifunctional phosphoribosylaminoimidazolecarboxamide formyltransferase/IMP cyclohydrolase [Legionella pneumophila subsp. pneumophila]MDW8870602.1 bifunctional phosphoribosylaminoimidazolecarboxamide formyltransferase/IMP cyclohydrolase [Legionella pneumophila]MDW8916534.1 bifunctional phosphoribosylaminoimidazolecarboxamide formyltransferase/IMP cyclohydrolase [Legion